MDIPLVTTNKRSEVAFKSCPLLLAVWPGFGNVGLVAGDYIRRKLDSKQLGAIDLNQLSVPQSSVVENGRIVPVKIPESTLHYTVSPDLIIYQSGAQLNETKQMLVLQTLIDIAKNYGVKQIVTVCAVPVPMSHGQPNQLFYAANSEELSGKLEKMGVKPLSAGEIAGPAGVLPALAKETGIEAACLMVTMPAYAGGTTYPKAAIPLVSCLAQMEQFRIDLTEIRRLSESLDEQFREIENRINEKIADIVPNTTFEQEYQYEQVLEQPDKKDEDGLDPLVQAKLDGLFEQVKKERSKASELKKELDRLGLFKKYENRFLDLFI